MADNQINGGVYNFVKPHVTGYTNLVEPKAFERNGKKKGEPKYGASFALEPDCDDLKGAKAAAIAVARAKWPNRNLSELRFPFADGDKLADKRIAKRKNEGKEPADDGKGDWMRGKVMLKTSSKYQPRLSVIVNGKVVDLDENTLPAHKGKFYFGVQSLAQINFVAYDGVDGGQDGVTGYLNLVLSTNKGDRLSGGASAAETFKGYVGSASTEDPTAGKRDEMDDEIPF